MVATESLRVGGHDDDMGIAEILLNVGIALAILGGLIWALKRSQHPHSETADPTHEK